MTLVIRPAELDAAELEAKPLAPPNAEPLSGEIIVRGKAQFVNDDRTIISGVWESDPGTSRWEFLTRGEIVHILAGRMTVQRDGEEAVELTAGSAAYFPIGWTGVWTVIEPVRKLYVVYKPAA
ncbi:cupin domain-containing protein [Microbacterium sp. IEGM 1404]|uniref:cupin domain-containing protein n=1 Tax=Microbacterium sp. IEGM 1404 TaxID=3047084 RepID=UPI0024B750A1|nr:cupin domain-containing protein [Microbacterium sp. IEGM 1404]MDI9891713.1 cupin domain-containing protein [Microbacterium sp. IEGM 1404]